MKTTRTRTRAKPIDVEISNVGPIEHLSLHLRPGVTILRARNGAGKTSAINATRRVLGEDAPVSARDGADRGVVESGGAKVLVRKVATRNGVADVALAEWSTVGDLIDPGIADPVKAEAKRVRALLSLAPIDVTREALEQLAGGSASEIGFALDEFADEHVTIVDAADAVRKHLHHEAREAEIDVARCEGSISAISASLPDVSVAGQDSGETAFAIAERLGTLRQDLARAKIEAEQRVAVERKVAALKSRHDPEPNLAAAESGLSAASGEYESARLAFLAAEQQFLESKRAFDAAGDALERRSNEHGRIRGAHSEWTERQALMRQIPTGPTAVEVEQLAVAVAVAEFDLDHARAVELKRSRLDELEAERGRLESLKERATRLRADGKTVGERLSSLLAANHVADVTIIDGRLHLRDGDTWIDWGARASVGQRSRVALTLAAKRSGSHVLAIDPAIWASLDPKARAEVAHEAAAVGCYLLTEAPSDDDEIVTEVAP